MTDQEILNAFVRPAAFPAAEIALAGERRADMAPLLIDEIVSWAEGRQPMPGDRYYRAAIAFHLLAEWRDTRAFKPVLALLGSPRYDILGDTLDEGGAALLARLYDGDAAAMTSFVHQQSNDEFARDAVFDAYVMLVIEGLIPRDDAHAFLLQALDTWPRTPDYIWCGWASAAARLVFEDLSPEVKALCDAGVIDEAFMDYDDYENDLAFARDGGGRRQRPLYGSPIAEMMNWDYSTSGDAEDGHVDASITDALLNARADGTAVNAYRDVGRNDPCPCGSGKKFKKCCLAKTEAGLM